MLSKRLLTWVKRQNKAMQVETTHMIDINTSEKQAASQNLLSKITSELCEKSKQTTASVNNTYVRHQYK